jgi:hypothetical protein
MNRLPNTARMITTVNRNPPNHYHNRKICPATDALEKLLHTATTVSARNSQAILFQAVRQKDGKVSAFPVVFESSSTSSSWMMGSYEDKNNQSEDEFPPNPLMGWCDGGSSAAKYWTTAEDDFPKTKERDAKRRKRIAMEEEQETLEDEEDQQHGLVRSLRFMSHLSDLLTVAGSTSSSAPRKGSEPDIEESTRFFVQRNARAKELMRKCPSHLEASNVGFGIIA